MQMLKKQTCFLLQSAAVWSTFSTAEVCKGGPQTSWIFASENQTAPNAIPICLYLSAEN